MGEHADLGDVIGVHDGDRVRGVGLGASLVAQDSEGQHRGADGPVVGDDRGDQGGVRGQVVGVEFPGVDRGGAGRFERADLVSELIGAARGQHHRRPGGQASRQLDPDFAASAQD